MKLRKWKSNHGDEIDLICTAEEIAMLREFLEHHGVNLLTSVWCPVGECTAYLRNPYREAIYGWGSDLCKEMGAEFFDRYKKGV